MYKMVEVQELQPGDILAEDYRPMQGNWRQLQVLNVEFAGPRILVKVKELVQTNRGAFIISQSDNRFMPEYWKEYTIHDPVSTLDVSQR